MNNKEIEPPKGTTPPLEWFKGFGTERDGIIVVMTSREFHALKDGMVAKAFLAWLRLPVTNPTEAEKAKRRLTDGYVKRATGFSIGALRDLQIRLNNEYSGKKTAPFRVQLTSEKEIGLSILRNNQN